MSGNRSIAHGRSGRAGTISSLYGLNAGIIDKTQFSLLVTVVVLSAVVPTAIAEPWFLPDGERERRLDRREAYGRVRGAGVTTSTGFGFGGACRLTVDGVGRRRHSLGTPPA